MLYGDPRCRYCHGRGYLRTWGRIARCGCVRPSPDVTAAIRQANTRPDRARMTVQDMLRAGSTSRRAGKDG